MSKKKKKKDSGAREVKSFKLAGEVLRAIYMVVMFTLALIFALSLFNRAGQAGIYIKKGIGYVFGAGAWLFPLVLILLAIYLFRSREKKYQIIKSIATGLFVLVYSSLLNLRLPADQLFFYLKQGRGGGYIGLALAYPLMKLGGFWLALVVITALGIVALLVMFETKLFTLGKGVHWILRQLRISALFGSATKGLAKKIKGQPEYIDDIQPGTAEEGLAPEQLPSAPVSPPTNHPAEKDGFKKSAVGSEDAEALSSSLRSRYRRKIDLPLNLLNQRTGTPSSGDINANKEKIRKTLENFGIEVEMGNTSTGPTVTQYTLKPQEGVKLAQITALSNDLALALAAHPIRIEAPIPGKSLAGVEVPNSVIAVVGLREVLQSNRFRTGRKSNLTMAIGRDVAGDPYMADLGKMPHLLIAGATGSGKSVCINSVIISFLYQNSPDDLKFILIDPKRVELSVYNGIPHLLTPVITDAKKTINALKWAVNEMDRRYDILAEVGKRNIESYNQSHEDHLPYIIIMIDELADLMSVAAKEVESLIVRLAQMARAVGIHLVLATQRPSVNVITGLIKANITARIAFAVASQTDSRTILDMAGAEKMLGRGDMLFITAELSKPKRLQGAYVDDKEIKRVVKFLREAAEPDYLEEVTERKVDFAMPGMAGSVAYGADEGDEHLDEARDLVIRAGKASASYLQRHLRIGYSRAARILDLLEAEGVIGPGDGAKPRDVLVRNQDTRNQSEAEERDL